MNRSLSLSVFFVPCEQYIAATGDTRGFEGFVKVGQREMTRVELTEQVC